MARWCSVLLLLATVLLGACVDRAARDIAAGKQCSTDKPCPSGFTCVAGASGSVCEPEGGCSENSECASGRACINSRCVTVCDRDGDCAPHERCGDGYCVAVENPSCTSNAECQSPAACESTDGASCQAGVCHYAPYRCMQTSPINACRKLEGRCEASIADCAGDDCCVYDAVWPTDSADPRPVCPLLGEDPEGDGSQSAAESWDGVCNHEGDCVTCLSHADCDDGNPCTADYCDIESACARVARTNQPCDANATGDGICVEDNGVPACRVALGHACSQPAECASGSCADGLCCDSDCSGLCVRCDLSGSEGSCEPAQEDSDCPTGEVCREADTCGPRVWGTPTLLRQGSEGALMLVDRTVAAAADANGNAMAVWAQPDGARNDLWAARFEVASGWQAPERLESRTGTVAHPDVAMHASGDAVAVWEQGGDIWASQYLVGTGWQAASRIETASGAAQRPRVAVAASGDVTAVWAQDDGTHVSVWANRCLVGSDWGVAARVETDDTADAWSPLVATDAAGNAFAAWSISDGTRNNAWATRFVVGTGPGTGWGVPEPIEKYGETVDVASIATDAQGNAFAVGTHNLKRLDIWANRYVVGTGWGNAFNVESDSEQTAYAPRVAVNAGGDAAVFWEERDLLLQAGSTRDLWVRRYVAGVGWRTGKAIDNGPFGTFLNRAASGVAIDASGAVLVTWLADSSLWSRHYVPGTGWGATVQIEDRSDNVGDHALAASASGDVFAVWVQPNGTAPNTIWANVFE